MSQKYKNKEYPPFKATIIGAPGQEPFKGSELLAAAMTVEGLGITLSKRMAKVAKDIGGVSLSDERAFFTIGLGEGVSVGVFDDDYMGLGWTEVSTMPARLNIMCERSYAHLCCVPTGDNNRITPGNNVGTLKLITSAVRLLRNNPDYEDRIDPKELLPSVADRIG